MQDLGVLVCTGDLSRLNRTARLYIKKCQLIDLQRVGIFYYTLLFNTKPHSFSFFSLKENKKSL